ncbi:MAG: hypothetical protein Q7U31_04555, partial [Anaerolineaceae bacterium]|nr:hypothetical protein [Anaerolineaceae bacterium]
MPRQRSIEEFTSEELRQLLVEKRRAEREARLESFRKTGRVIQVETENPIIPNVIPGDDDEPEEEPLTNRRRARNRRKKGMERFLFIVEILAIVGLVVIIFQAFNVLNLLNEETAGALAMPQLTPTALITAVVLPSGHTAPVEGVEVRPNDAE